jgi:hypothetical protein
MAQKRIIFDPQSLISLLTHYTDGKVPLDTIVKGVKVHPELNRTIGFECESAQWSNTIESEKSPGVLAPLVVRYEGKKTLSWGGKHEEMRWTDSVEAPKQQ